MTFVEHRRNRPPLRSLLSENGSLARSLSHAGEREERSTAALFLGRPIGRYYCGSGERQHPLSKANLGCFYELVV